VRIDIATVPAPDEATLRSAIEHVFYAPNTNLAPFVPDYWRDLLTGNLVRKTDPDGSTQLSFRSGCPSGVSTDAPPEVQPSGIRKVVCSGLTIYRPIKGGVMPPKPLHTPDPKYVEFARQSKYQGTTVLWLVVDQTGHTQMIRIVRAIGMGLDDMAVETVRNWLFKPAELNGQPVAVEINVEASFRLY
jgi:TonB family protein